MLVTYEANFFASRWALFGLLLIFSGLAFAGCENADFAAHQVQTASHASPAVAPATDSEIDSPLGNYLAGRLARKENDVAAAAAYFERALDEDPENSDLMRETFLATLFEGRVDDAVNLARRLHERGSTGPYTSLVLAVHELKNDNFAEALTRLKRIKRRGYNVLLVPLVTAWTQVGLGDYESAHKALDRLSNTQAFVAFQDFHGALIDDIAGNHEAAEAAYLRVLERQPGGTMRSVAALGGFYERLGRDADAAKLYRSYQENNPDSVSFQRALERIESGQPAAALVTEARAGAAEALFGVANALFQENALEPALFYARISIYLRRDSDASHLFLGQVLESLGRPQQAIDAYRAVSRASPLFWSARLRVATSLDSLDKTEEALDELSAMASERAERADALITIGDLLRSKQRWTEAASAYDRAFNRIGNLERRHWRPLYARGISLERSQQWDRAEADFLKALELEPNQPFVLNYLGYSWVDQGTHLQRALKMIERAVDLRPNDGYIIDSLGWALFRLGEYGDAVTHLERAVELRPDDPTINDHLGDAYWRVGREVEARFQWSRALILEPEEDQISGIESKIANGLSTDLQREGKI